ncbi:carbamoyltransferase [Roseivirga sp. BDSF3-8]|uniref:carbamoyltransferase family protein n=1 Tax=Roseivirga sp. BDSF3-8 TaxID=3241598 RepID=UPI003531F6EC
MKSVYVLGTAVSHQGSACLLKDGKILVAIEKERITRRKKDGGNDQTAIQYCLDAAGITIDDVDLIVQNDNYSDFKFGNDYFEGPRPLFANVPDSKIKTISHHLAHAYSTIGTCPYEEFNMLIYDGCGNAYEDCIDVDGARIADKALIEKMPHLFLEKDSYYSYGKEGLTSLVKDFSEWGYLHRYPIYPVTTKHSIGGLYAGVSIYCFGNMSDSGKLMGLAPFGREGKFQEEVFECRDGRVFVKYDWMNNYRNPARGYDEFKQNFQYYADIAYGIQKEVERAILYMVNERLKVSHTKNLCLAGGTALNAVANDRIFKETDVENLYIEPASGDNGLAIGCAYYGYLEVMKMDRIIHDQSTFFGKTYSNKQVEQAYRTHATQKTPVQAKKIVDTFFTKAEELYVDGTNSSLNFCIQFDIEDLGIYQVQLAEGKLRCYNTLVANPTCMIKTSMNTFLQGIYQPGKRFGKDEVSVSNMADFELFFKIVDLQGVVSYILNSQDASDDTSNLHAIKSADAITRAAELLAEGKTMGWFQGGSEFGPRALGHRSILADPRNPEMQKFINAKVKFREDFRPFAPSVLREDVDVYFQENRESPYMILVDQIKPEWKEKLSSIVHVNNSCRIQTVTPDWNPEYYKLLQEFKKITGVSVLLNTSFNRRGMPIVETPGDAIKFFNECALDVLVMNDYIFSKEPISKKEAVSS